MNVDKPHKCMECGKSFGLKCSLTAHLRTHTGDKPFQCLTCSKCFTQSGHLKEHIRTHTGERPYQCATCGKAFMNGSHLRAHMRTHNTSTNGDSLQAFSPLHICPICSKGFNHLNTLKAHQTVHAGSKAYLAAIRKKQLQMLKRFSCDLCGAAFRAKHSLKTHLLTHSGHRPHVCTVCPKAFTQSCHLREHMLTHNTSAIHLCKVCGIKCKSVRHARKHAKSHNKNGNSGSSGNVVYKCNVCSDNFHKLERLKTHMQRHTGEKIFKCGICSRSFGENSLLVSHMRTHSGERPFPCNICPKRFAQRSVLRCHLKMHAGDKRYKCDVCDKRFITQSDVVKHSRVHTKEKPFACQFCNSCFSRSNHLSRHVKIHFRSKKTTIQTDTADCTQSSAIDNLYPQTQTINPPPVEGTGAFLKVNNLYGYFENIERSSMKTIHPGDSFEQNKFVQDDNFMNFEGTLGLEEEHRLNNYIIENHRDGEVLKYNFEIYDAPRFQYEPNNEVRNQYEKNGGTDPLYPQDIPVEMMERIIVPAQDARIKLSCRWRYPNTGAHLKNSCKEVSNKTMDNSKPWQCGICDASFKEQDQLKEHINEHKSVMPSVKYTKLVKNPDTGTLEEKDVIPRNKLKLVSKEVIEPIINAHFAKDKLIDPPVVPVEEQNILNPAIKNNQFEEVREYNDWSHEQQNYRDTVIIERQEYFKECQEKQTIEQVNYERSQVIMDIENYKDNPIMDETNQTYIHSEYIQENTHNEIHIPDVLNPTVSYVYEHDNPVLEQSISCQDIIDIQQYKTHADLTAITAAATHMYTNDQGEYLQITDCPDTNVHDGIDQAISYVYEQENNVVDQAISQIHQEEVHIADDIGQPIEYIYEHKKGFIAQKMSLMHNENITISNEINEVISFDYNKDIMPHDQSILMTDADVNETANYMYELKNGIISHEIPSVYENIIVNIQEAANTQLQADENALFDISMQCQKDVELINNINYETNYKRVDEFVMSDNLHKPVEYLPQDVCVDTCLTTHLKTIDHNVDDGLCQSEFSFLDHSDEQDMLTRDKSVISEAIEEYKFNNGPLMEDSYDNIDSLPTINPTTQELQESYPVTPVAEENDPPVEEESVIKKCEDTKNKEKYACNECSKSFKHSHTLVDHLRTHSGERPYECTQCPSKFTQRTHLREHLLAHSNQRNHQCHMCGKAFLKASHLKSHIKIHSDESDYKCDKCNRSFKHRLGWQLHQNTHGEDTPYKCDVCGKGFRHPTTLVSHQRIHTGSRPYACNCCQATFSQLSTLISHQRVHTDARPHICPQCSKGFRSIGDLNRHIQIHSGIKDFACVKPGCAKTFGRKSHLIRHIATHKVVDSVT